MSDIIKPVQSDGIVLNKYSVDLEQVDPVEVLAVLHKRVVDTEGLVRQFSIKLNNIAQDVEMLNGSFKELLERIKNIENK